MTSGKDIATFYYCIKTLAYSIRNAEHTGEYLAEPEVTSLTLDEVVAIVDGFLGDPTCVEATYKFLEELKFADPASFKIIADDTEGLSAMLGSSHPPLPSAIQAVMSDPTVKLSKDGTAITVYDNGRLKHMCLFCGKLYDRKPRADDCRNRHRGVKPYACHGECGKRNCDKSYALEELLTRHLAGKVKCSKCHAEVSQQNLARHMASCLKH